MDKKILKAMYASAVSRDSLRPVMQGVHFESERCYASDTHILVVYNQGSPNHDGKTLTIEGEDIKGNYPAIDRVIPQDMPNEPLMLNLRQLHKALKWHKVQPYSHQEDKIAFGSVILNIEYLCNLLNVIDAANELSSTLVYLNEQSRPSKFLSPSITAIIMPFWADGADIDGKREQDCPAILSYETIINDYAYNSWRKPVKQEEFAWLS